MRFDRFGDRLRDHRAYRKPATIHSRELANSFNTVVHGLYIRNKLCSPWGSSLAGIDPVGARPAHWRWSPSSAHIAIDCENAITAALGGDHSLITQFMQWFVMPEVDPETHKPVLNVAETKIHTSIVEWCGREFIKRKLFPLDVYFNRQGCRNKALAVAA